MPDKDEPLSEFEEKFCSEYLLDLDGRQACLRAGHPGKGSLIASNKMLSDVRIQNRLRGLRDKLMITAEVKAEDILRNLVVAANLDVLDVYDEKGNLKKLSDIPPEIRRTIQSVEVSEMRNGVGYINRVKFIDKIKALELLGKHMSLFKEIHEHTLDGALSELMLQARERRLANEERTVEAVVIGDVERAIELPEKVPGPAEERVLNPKRPNGFIPVGEIEELNGCPKCFTEFSGKVCPQCEKEINRHGS